MIKPTLPKLVLEAGTNHQGSMELAKKMILSAAASGAYAIKFQKRTIEECYTPEELDTVYRYPNGETCSYREHREKLEFSIDQHAELKRFCGNRGLVTRNIKYSCSVWDETSLKEVLQLGVDWVKIPSAKNNAEWVWHGEKPIPRHMSMGMVEVPGEDSKLTHPHSDWAIPYVCTSAYPCAAKDAVLSRVLRLRTAGFSEIGISGHWNGIHLDHWAQALGCQWLERHFTLDRSMQGPDHAFSLEPHGVAKLVRNMNQFYEAFGDGAGHWPGILECEMPFARKYGRL